LKPKNSWILLNCPKNIGHRDYEIEVEYQAETIGKYDLSFNGKILLC
jgi:hypothetical protein